MMIVPHHLEPQYQKFFKEYPVENINFVHDILPSFLNYTRDKNLKKGYLTKICLLMSYYGHIYILIKHYIPMMIFFKSSRRQIGFGRHISYNKWVKFF